MSESNGRKFRYQGNGRWFKGNTHIHSNLSDGSADHAAIAAQYGAAGYDFLCATDHWICSDFSNAAGSMPLTWINGVELDGNLDNGNICHMVALGSLEGIHREMGILAAIEASRLQQAYLILAHPHWSANTLTDVADLRPHAVEVHNTVCNYLNGKGNGAVYWTENLAQFPNLGGVASDDLHFSDGKEGWNEGWIMVNAAECTQESILAALFAGEYYATEGPEIYELTREDGFVHIRCSPVKYIQLCGPGPHCYQAAAFNGEGITKASFPIREDWSYSYLHLEDVQKRNAWTNHLFIE